MAAAAQGKPDTTPGDELAAAMKRAEQLEAENAALKAAIAPVDGPTRLSWVVIYPQISLQERDADGKAVGEPVIFKQGQTLPAEYEDQAEGLRRFGHVTALQVPAQ